MRKSAIPARLRAVVVGKPDAAALRERWVRLLADRLEARSRER